MIEDFDGRMAIEEAPLFLDPAELELEVTELGVAVGLRPCANLSRFIDALLTDSEAAEFEQHWRGCMTCCRAVREVERARSR